MTEIRPLTTDDIDALLSLRREALETDPAGFSASPDDDVGLDREFVLAALAQPDIQVVLGAFSDGVLVGMTGVHLKENVKEAHKADLWGMYVRPANRGSGLGASLLAEAITFASSLSGVTQLHLCVSESAADASRLYERAGFTTWGVEPASFHVDGRFVTVRHMLLDLTETSI